MLVVRRVIMVLAVLVVHQLAVQVAIVVQVVMALVVQTLHLLTEVQAVAVAQAGIVMALAIQAVMVHLELFI